MSFSETRTFRVCHGLDGFSLKVARSRLVMFCVCSVISIVVEPHPQLSVSCADTSSSNWLPTTPPTPHFIPSNSESSEHLVGRFLGSTHEAFLGPSQGVLVVMDKLELEQREGSCRVGDGATPTLPLYPLFLPFPTWAIINSRPRIPSPSSPWERHLSLQSVNFLWGCVTRFLPSSGPFHLPLWGAFAEITDDLLALTRALSNATLIARLWSLCIFRAVFC